MSSFQDQMTTSYLWNMSMNALAKWPEVISIMEQVSEIFQPINPDTNGDVITNCSINESEMAAVCMDDDVSKTDRQSLSKLSSLKTAIVRKTVNNGTAMLRRIIGDEIQLPAFADSLIEAMPTLLSLCTVAYQLARSTSDANNSEKQSEDVKTEEIANEETIANSIAPIESLVYSIETLKQQQESDDVERSEKSSSSTEQNQSFRQTLITSLPTLTSLVQIVKSYNVKKQANTQLHSQQSSNLESETKSKTLLVDQKTNESMANSTTTTTVTLSSPKLKQELALELPGFAETFIAALPTLIALITLIHKNAFGELMQKVPFVGDRFRQFNEPNNEPSSVE